MAQLKSKIKSELSNFLNFVVTLKKGPKTYLNLGSKIILQRKFFFFFFLFTAAPMAYRSFQSRGRIGAATEACPTGTETLDPS